jgi:hypothetical protein
VIAATVANSSMSERDESVEADFERTFNAPDIVFD